MRSHWDFEDCFSSGLATCQWSKYSNNVSCLQCIVTLSLDICNVCNKDFTVNINSKDHLTLFLLFIDHFRNVSTTDNLNVEAVTTDVRDGVDPIPHDVSSAGAGLKNCTFILVLNMHYNIHT